MKPIFLISLPRSGSTLLQRILMGHPEIASKAESWLMLPLVYMLRREGLLSEYNQRDAHFALVDFINELPKGRTDYVQSLQAFALDLYTKQGNGCQYFLEKTPRYYLIARELDEIFPDAKFIFLVRNPLQTIASIISTFKLKNIHFYMVDLHKGFQEIVTGMRHFGNRAFFVKYEDLVSDHEKTVSALFTFLDLPAPQVNRLDDRGLKGRMGDKKGTYQYQSVNDASIDKWKSVLGDLVLNYFARRVISRTDATLLAEYGYDKRQLSRELSEIRSTLSTQSFRNMLLLAGSHLIVRLKLNVHRKRIQRWARHIVIN